jgi:GTPase SAR1 family protein
MIQIKITTILSNTEMAPPLTFAFTGLPSVGKSTMINSLIGKRILQSGICRTTYEPYYIGDVDSSIGKNVHNARLISDDKYTYNVLDLPGVNDINDVNNKSETNYDEITEANITNCNVLLWLTDIKTAFSTRHEQELFNKYIDILKKNSIETGTLYQYGIVLTKCDFDDADNTVNVALSDCSDSEISCDEDTTLIDRYNDVVKLFPNVKIMKFNAYGRIHSMRCSQSLKKVAKLCANINTNTKFNIQYFCDDYEKKQIQCTQNSFEDQLKRYTEYHNNTHKHAEIIKLLDSIYTHILNNRKHLVNNIINFIYHCKYPTMVLTFVSHIKGILSTDVYTQFVHRIGNKYVLPQNSEYLIAVAEILYPNDIIYYRLFFANIRNTNVSHTIYVRNTNALSCNNIYSHSQIITLSGRSTNNIFYSNNDNYMKTLSKYIKFDVDITNNITTAASKKWIDNLKIHRVFLWGDLENDVDINMLINLVIHDKVSSLMTMIT